MIHIDTPFKNNQIWTRHEPKTVPNKMNQRNPFQKSNEYYISESLYDPGENTFIIVFNMKTATAAIQKQFISNIIVECNTCVWPYNIIFFFFLISPTWSNFFFFFFVIYSPISHCNYIDSSTDKWHHNTMTDTVWYGNENI